MSRTEDNGRGGHSAGALLREARTAENLAVADVARQLKLTPHQVEALEAGDFGRLPGPVFVRGFIRNYARLLKLDPEPLLQAVAPSLPREDALPVPPSVEVPFPSAAPRRWGAYAGGVALIVAALAVYEYFPTSTEPPAVSSTAATPPSDSAPARAPEAAGATAPASAIGPSGGALPEQAQGAEQARTETRESGGGAAVEPRRDGGAATPDRGHGVSLPAAAPSAAQDAPPAAPRIATRDEEPAPGSGERQVRMVFDQASWVEIRDRSGKAIFSQMNAPGTEQRVSGRPPLAVIVGNAHGVRLTYDERPVNLSLHTKVDVARLTLP